MIQLLHDNQSRSAKDRSFAVCGFWTRSKKAATSQNALSAWA
jgi:hypothetical protein